MELSKQEQVQKAGDNSQQYQLIGNNSSQTIVEQQKVYCGPTISDWTTFTTTLTTQVTALALSQCAQVAESKVVERVNAVNEAFLPRIEYLEGAIENLQDPKFQFMIKDAYLSAAKSSRSEDIQLLSELLACHIEKGKDMKVDAGIHKAIQIVSDVDYDSLCGLTMVVTILIISPTSGDIIAGLKVLNDLYSRLLTTILPEGDDWIDHLSVLGTINVSSGRFPKAKQILPERLNGYVCTGVKAQSDEYNEAISILSDNGFNSSCLVPNVCLDGYYRLPIVHNESLKEPLKPILDLYAKDSNLLNVAKQNFMNLWDSFDSLKEARIWFEKIPFFFRANSVGLALSQTNAKRCYSGFPDLI